MKKVKDHIRCEVMISKGRYTLVEWVDVEKVYSSEIKGKRFTADKMYDVIFVTLFLSLISRRVSYSSHIDRVFIYLSIYFTNSGGDVMNLRTAMLGLVILASFIFLQSVGLSVVKIVLKSGIEILLDIDPNEISSIVFVECEYGKVPLSGAEANTVFTYLGKVRSPMNAIDGDLGTHWAGKDDVWAMILTIYLKGVYEINMIKIWQDGSQITEGVVEYYDVAKKKWEELLRDFPQRKEITFEFSPVKTDRIRLVVYDVVYPPSWYNKSPTIKEVEIYGYLCSE